MSAARRQLIEEVMPLLDAEETIETRIDRINGRERPLMSAYLIQGDDGKPLSQFALRSRFDKARELAKVSFQFRDIRAKAATDTGDLAHSQKKLLAHKNRDMTEHYVRARLGERVKPLR